MSQEISQWKGVTSGIFAFEIPVIYSQLDPNGHVNNMYYNDFCVEGVIRMCAEGGVDVNEMSKNGIGPVVYKAEYAYLEELKYGDIALIECRIRFTKKNTGCHGFRN